MEPIYYIDRHTRQLRQEQVYGAKALRFFYGNGWLSKFCGTPLSTVVSKLPFLSSFYGWLQKLPRSKKKVLPFIKTYDVDASEFLAPPDSFSSFNDFFIRRLKPQARPIAPGTNTAIIPADGRYFFYQHIDRTDGFVVKGKKFDLGTLLQNQELAQKYAQGAMVMARLCPSDYHRFHFPVDCIPEKTKEINGWLYSVNPAAIKKNVNIFTENKRTLCILDTQTFGQVLFLEIGATFVGSIHQTYQPFQKAAKGDEKGYFSFGGSSLIILFLPGSIRLDGDLVQASAGGLEIKCLMGQSMGLTVAQLGQQS